MTYVSKNYPEIFILQLFVISNNLPVKFAIFLKRRLLFSVCKQNFTAQYLKNQNSYECKNFSVVCVEAIIFLRLYNLHNCTFKCNFKFKKKRKSDSITCWKPRKKTWYYKARNLRKPNFVFTFCLFLYNFPYLSLDASENFNNFFLIVLYVTGIC